MRRTISPKHTCLVFGEHYIDPGKTVGIAAVAKKKNGRSVCLFAQELTTRSDVIKADVKTRSDLRRGRRNRNTRYRKPRFQNRRSSKSACKSCGGNTQTSQKLCGRCKQEGHHVFSEVKKRHYRIPPSIRSRWDATLSAIGKIPLPTPQKIYFEDNYFDIRALSTPEAKPVGKEYQIPLHNERHAKAACKTRDEGRCFRCNQSERIVSHHIKHRKDGGTDILQNLVTLCSSCHNKLHNQPKELSRKELDKIISRTKIFIKKGALPSKKKLKNAQIAQQGKNYFLTECEKLFGKPEKTAGFTTQFYRRQNNLPKSHATDAVMIADSGAELPESYIKTACVKSRSRQLHVQKPPKSSNLKKKNNKINPKNAPFPFAYESKRVVEQKDGTPDITYYNIRDRRGVSYLEKKGKVFRKHDTVKVLDNHNTKTGEAAKGTICFIASFSGNSAHLKSAVPDGKKSFAKSVSLNKLQVIHHNQGRLSGSVVTKHFSEMLDSNIAISHLTAMFYHKIYDCKENQNNPVYFVVKKSLNVSIKPPKDSFLFEIVNSLVDSEQNQNNKKHTCHYTQTKIELFDLGLKQVSIGNKQVLVTGLERTLLDGLESPQKCKGFKEVLAGFRLAKENFDLKKIVELALKLNSFTQRRLGYILGQLGFNYADIDQLSLKLTDKTKNIWLNPDNPNNLDKNALTSPSWKLKGVLREYQKILTNKTLGAL